MPTLCCNDLIGLPYQWGARPEEGATDCFMLCGTIRRRLGLSDYFQEYGWLYDKWDGTTFPASIVLRWLRKHGRVGPPRVGAVACIQSAKGFALGTVVDDDGVVYISPGERVTRAPVRLLNDIEFYWDGP